MEIRPNEALTLRRIVNQMVADLKTETEGPFKVCVTVYSEAEGEDVRWQADTGQPKPAPKRQRRKPIAAAPEGEAA